MGEITKGYQSLNGNLPYYLVHHKRRTDSHCTPSGGFPQESPLSAPCMKHTPLIKNHLYVIVMNLLFIKSINEMYLGLFLYVYLYVSYQLTAYLHPLKQSQKSHCFL